MYNITTSPNYLTNTSLTQHPPSNTHEKHDHNKTIILKVDHIHFPILVLSAGSRTERILFRAAIVVIVGIVRGRRIHDAFVDNFWRLKEGLCADVEVLWNYWGLFASHLRVAGLFRRGFGLGAAQRVDRIFIQKCSNIGATHYVSHSFDVVTRAMRSSLRLASSAGSRL